MRKLPEHGSCFICGSENPHNIGLTWYVDEKGVVSCGLVRVRLGLKSPATPTKPAALKGASRKPPAQCMEAPAGLDGFSPERASML